MVSFCIALCLLVVGFLVYGRVVERVFAPDNRTTPATALNDGVDYVPMKPWRIFMIQFLNIAGLGPIFGAVMGAKFGLASYFWIVLGCIFGGAVHDYMAGMLSMRNDGCNLPELHGKYLGAPFRQFSRIFTAFLLLLTAAAVSAGIFLLLRLLNRLHQTAAKAAECLILGFTLLNELSPGAASGEQQ